MKKFTNCAQKIVKFNTTPKFGLVRRFGGVKTAKKNIVAKNSPKMPKTLVFNQGKNRVKNLGNSLVLKNSVSFNKISMRKFCIKNRFEIVEKEQTNISNGETDANFKEKINTKFGTNSNAKFEKNLKEYFNKNFKNKDEEREDPKKPPDTLTLMEKFICLLIIVFIAPFGLFILVMLFAMWLFVVDLLSGGRILGRD